MKKLLLAFLLGLPLLTYGQPTPGGGGPYAGTGTGGGATNGIQMLNGTGTNTTIRGLTITGTGNVQTNFVRVTTATGNGSTDDTTAIQANIDATIAAGGGVLVFPCGTFKLTATLIINSSNVTIQGSGECTVFQATGDYGDVFYARPTVDPTTPGTFTGIQFLNFCVNGPTNNRTSGAAIHTKWTHNALIRDVRIGNFPYNVTNALPFYDGIYMENQDSFIMENCQVAVRAHGVITSAHKLPGTGGVNAIGGQYFNGLLTGNCEIWGDPLFREGTNCIGVWIKGGNSITNGNGGFQIEQTSISYFVNGVHVTGTNRELFIGHAFSADVCGGSGILIDAGSLTIFQSTGGWCAGNGTSTLFGGRYGIEFADDINLEFTFQPKISIVGGTFYNNAAAGIYLGSGKGIISSVSAYGNGTNDIKFGAGFTGIPMVIGSYAPNISVANVDPSYNFPFLLGNVDSSAFVDGNGLGLITNYSEFGATTLRAYSRIYAAGATLPIGSPVAGNVLTATDTSGTAAWSNVTAGVASLLPAQFLASAPPIDLTSTTNVNCAAAYVFYRATTNTAIAFQLTNETSGVSYEVHLFNTGGTATPNVTITASTGKQNRVAGVTPAQTITYGSPVANRELIIRFSNLGNTNYMTFEDNQ